MHNDYGYFEDEQLGQINDLRLWRRVARFVRPQWRWVLLSVLLSSIITVTSLALPRIVQLAMDRHILSTQTDIEERLAGITALAGAFLIAILIGFIANFLQVLALEWAGQNPCTTCGRACSPTWWRSISASFTPAPSDASSPG